MAHLPQPVFFWKTINLRFMYLLATFIMLNLKILCVDLELWSQTIFGPKMAQFAQNIYIFLKNH